MRNWDMQYKAVPERVLGVHQDLHIIGNIYQNFILPRFYSNMFTQWFKETQLHWHEEAETNGFKESCISEP